GAGDTDMTAQLAKIKANPKVQAVLNAGFGQGPAIVTRNYRQLGIAAPLYQSHGVASKQYVKRSGEAGEGVRLPAAALLVADRLPGDDPQKKVVTAYKQEYESRYKQEVSTFGGHAYDGLMLVVDAIRRAGTTDKARVRDAPAKTRGYVGTGGVANMSASDHMGLDLSAFRVLEDGKGEWHVVKERRKPPVSATLVQFVLSGLTAGAIYALVALGFALIYIASGVINFAQGEFVMIGGMATASFIASGVPLFPAVLLAILAAVLVGLALE